MKDALILSQVIVLKEPGFVNESCSGFFLNFNEKKTLIMFIKVAVMIITLAALISLISPFVFIPSQFFPT
jgi:hypothetical protein